MPPAKDDRPRIDLHENMFRERQEHKLFDQSQAYAYRYMDELDARPVYPSAETIASLAAFDEPLPGTSQPPADILRLLHTHGSPATVAQTGGRYFGFVNGGAVPVALAAKWLSTVWDQNAALFVLSPIAAKLEAVCQSWLIDLFGLPVDTVAGFVSGTSTATLCGLAAGRNALFRRMGWDVNARGLYEAPRLRIICSAQAHATVFKALALLGFGVDAVERVPVDCNGGIDADRMPPLDERSLVLLQAGNVNSGGFDPIDPICEEAARVGAWVHIDGAFGLWAAGSRQKRHLVAGMEKAHSWSVDGHKTLNAPYDCGIVLCRQSGDLTSAMQLAGVYIHYSDKRDSMMYTPEMSRRNRAVELWATLKYLGRRGIEELIDGLCDRAAQFADRLGRAGFRIMNEVVFNQVLVAGGSADETEAVLRELQASGECWCGGSVWGDEPVIRISVCSWATTPADVDRAVDALVKARALSRST